MSAEKLGIPAAAIITDRFAGSARAMAEANGLADYPFAVIAHPVAGNTDDELREKAEQAVGLLVPLLTRRPPQIPLPREGERAG
jgi:alkanesulfonate monooxygenase SsuD/methylene tetrahydromethanopterin reductase-like flavin-dependent oxidoreductase (luciferase family)